MLRVRGFRSCFRVGCVYWFWCFEICGVFILVLLFVFKVGGSGVFGEGCEVVDIFLM